MTLYGRALLLAGDNERALRALRDASRRRPVWSDTYFWLAEAAERLGRTGEAREARARHAALTGDARHAPAPQPIGLLQSGPDLSGWLARAAEAPTANPSLLLRLAYVEGEPVAGESP